MDAAHRSSPLVRLVRRPLAALLALALVAPLFAASGTVQIDATTPQKKPRKPSPPLSSLPAPRAGGAPRILLVDDDYSENNYPKSAGRLSESDEIFRQLTADAVGGDATAWSVVVVEAGKNGPKSDELRGFNLVIWYNGGSYGGAYDNTGVLSLEDEKTARAYLEETGGSFVLLSPGYMNAHTYGNTWDDAPVAFLTEVVGINGFRGLAKRFAAGSVTSPDGTAFTVLQKGPIEPIFSVVNPDGAAVVFTSVVDSKDGVDGAPLPVAVANAFAGGRFAYFGFSFENIGAADRAKAFGQVLAAAGHADLAGKTATATTAAPTGAPKPASGPADMAKTGPGTTPPPTPGTTRVATTKQMANDTVRTIQPPPEAPPGPAPTNLEFTAQYPAAHSFRWIATGMDSFEVFRRDAGSWTFLKGGFRDLNYTDRSFVAPNSAYKVVAVYADGRRGEAILDYPNPPQPAVPTQLRAVQIGPEKVQIDWVNVPGFPRYRVFGPGVPAAGEVVMAGTEARPDYGGRLVMNYMPNGVHEIRVSTVYNDTLVTPVSASTRVAVNPDRGRYRVLLVGAKVNSAGPDGADDGAGQEVFAGAFVAQAPQTGNAPATSLPSARTGVYGDTGAFSGRNAAGSASATGGLRTGDFVPNANVLMPQPGAAGFNDRFPLLVWEGELIEDGPAVSVIPVIFEWGAVNHSAWTSYANHWPGGNVLQKLGDAMRTNLRAPLAPQPLYGTWVVQDFTRAADEPEERRPVLVQFLTNAGYDRPVGLVLTSRPGQVETYGHDIQGWVLTRPRVEAALAGQSLVRLEQRWSDRFSGGYSVYLQIERLTAAPVVVPPTATAINAAPPLLAGGTAIVTPAPVPATTTPPPLTQVGATGITTVKTLEPVTPPPVGPAPQQVSITSDHAARHVVKWTANGATTFDVLRQQGDQWITVVAGTSFTMAVDNAFVAPGTVYQVVGHHADGRVGTTDFTLANPAQPKTPNPLKAEQAGERRVKLTWTPDSDVGSTEYRVFAPGQPAEGLAVPWKASGDLTVELTNLPETAMRFRVAKRYGQLTAPVDTTLNFTVTPWRGHYRAVLLGFRLGRKTVDDDILDGDGRGDEVFFTANRAILPPGAATSGALGLVQTVVMGDTDRFASRVRAGQASGTGGIRSGDVVPSAAALGAQTGVATTNDRLPLLLWDGWLTGDGDAAVIALTAWEWDNSSMLPTNSWVSWWNTPNGSAGLRVAARDFITATPDEIRYIPLTLTYEVEPEKPLIEDRLAIPPPPGAGRPREKRYLGLSISGRPIVTRPLGALKLGDPDWYCVPHGFALTRRNLEKTLRSARAIVIESPLRAHRGPTANNPAEEDESEYSIVVQFERIEGAVLYP